MRAPSARSAAISSSTAALTSIAALSVNSSSISDSGTLGVGERLAKLERRSRRRSTWRGLMLNARRPSKPSRCQLPSTLATSPSTQSPISAMTPVRLGDRNEGARQAQAVARMVPAQQRLGADDLAGDQAHLRLEGEHELAALDGFGQRLFGVDLLLMLGRKVGVEQAMLAAADRLGAIHGDVRGAHQRFDAGAVIGRDGDADRRADVDAVRAQLERLGDGEHDPARDALDLVDRIDFREEHRELVAGEAREQRPGPGAAGEFGVDDDAKAVGDHDQQLVAAGMAEAVVDHLEAVEVDEQHRRVACRRALRSAACRLRSGNAAGWEAR